MMERGREGRRGREEERESRKEDGKEMRDVGREGERDRGTEGDYYFQQLRIYPVSECLLLHSLILACQVQRSLVNIIEAVYITCIYM